MTLSLLLEGKDVPRLIKHFGNYSHNTGLIQMYVVDGKKEYIKYNPKYNGSNFLLPLNLHIKYHREDRGIKWVIRCHKRDDFNSYTIEATINPKLLAGISDYITAATYNDMETAIASFNNISNGISPLLSTFDCYRIQRVDYCINFCVNELAPGCTPEQIMALIRRSDIPPHYTEWEKYNGTAHRKKSSPNSFYLTTPYVNINCYNKYAKLQEQSQQNMEQGYPPIPQATLETAKGIIRFEVQCKYHKMYALSYKTKESKNSNVNHYQYLLDDITCDNIINDYFKKTVGRGDWYTLHDAIHMIQLQHFNIQKEKRLIDALRFVNNCRGLAEAKTAYKNHGLEKFKRTLKDLSSLGINPVTIPKWWGIKHIPNLLYTYYDKIQEEKSKKEMEKFKMECLNEYIKPHKHLPV